MELHFKTAGSDRKKLVEAVSRELGIKAVYLKVPTCAYRIGAYQVSREGVLSFPDETGLDESSRVIDACVMAGFAPAEWGRGNKPEQTGRTADTGLEDAETSAAEEETELPDTEGTGLTIELPLDCTDAGRLKLLLEAKGNLIKAALGLSALPVEIRENTIVFPWFTAVPAPEEAEACTELLAAIAKLAKEAKRVTAKEREEDNPKYAFRCFLLRLGFIGGEYKDTRKVLLRRLSGSAAFRSTEKGGRQ